MTDVFVKLSYDTDEFVAGLCFSSSNFRRSVNVVFYLLGDSSPSAFYMPAFRNTLSFPKRRHVKFGRQGNRPKRRNTTGLLLFTIK